MGELKLAGSQFSDFPSPFRIALPPATESSAVSPAESITKKRVKTPFLPQTPGPRVQDSASQSAPQIAATASERYEETDDVILMPHPDASASSSRAVTTVAADQQFSRVIV